MTRVVSALHSSRHVTDHDLLSACWRVLAACYTGKMCIHLTTLCTLNVPFCLSCSNSQRVGAIGNLTTEEYAARQPNTSGGCQITVHQHKTAAQGVAVLFATSELEGLLQEYSTVIHLALKPTSNNFFCMLGGGIVTKLSARLAVLGKACVLKLPAAGV